MAVPLQLDQVQDEPLCDPLVVPLLVDELGIAPPFPMEEVLRVADAGTSDPPCPSTNNTPTPDLVVSITNANPILPKSQGKREPRFMPIRLVQRNSRG